MVVLLVTVTLASSLELKIIFALTFSSKHVQSASVVVYATFYRAVPPTSKTNWAVFTANLSMSNV